MGYSDSIENLKSALNSFSEDEKRLTELYKTALQNAENEFKASTERLESNYKSDRNDAISDVMREERNMFNILASRGLGFSGEAAQAKLNSDIILANRLGELANEKNQNAYKLEQELANKKQGIALESAEKQSEIFDKATDLKTQIAKLELEKEQREAELQAENDRFNRQLAAQYSSSAKDDESETGYIPEISEKELAKILISNASDGESYKNTETQFYLVSRYLIDLKDNYNLDSDYFKNLLLILKSYGYTQMTDSMTRAKVVSYEATRFYDKQFDKFYDKYVVGGQNEKDARVSAKSSALRSTLEYIASKSRNTNEFRSFCRESGIDDGSVNDYLKSSNAFK